MPNRAPWHLLRSWDALGRPCWLLHAQAMPSRIRAVLRRVAEFHFHCDAEIGVLVIDPEGIDQVCEALQHHLFFESWCVRCLLGDPCGVWDTRLLEREGYRSSLTHPQHRAAARMGLTVPWTRDQVQVAFRGQALRAHPDHGGSDAVMRQLLTDRDLLLDGAET